MAPEVWSGKPYDSKADLWSAGVVAYECAALQPPFTGRTLNDLSRAVRGGVFRPLPSCYSAELGDAVKLMLTVAPSRRLSAAQLLALPFMRRKRRELGDASSGLAIAPPGYSTSEGGRGAPLGGWPSAGGGGDHRDYDPSLLGLTAAGVLPLSSEDMISTAALPEGAQPLAGHVRGAGAGAGGRYAYGAGHRGGGGGGGGVGPGYQQGVGGQIVTGSGGGPGGMLQALLPSPRYGTIVPHARAHAADGGGGGGGGSGGSSGSGYAGKQEGQRQPLVSSTGPAIAVSSQHYPQQPPPPQPRKMQPPLPLAPVAVVASAASAAALRLTTTDSRARVAEAHPHGPPRRYADITEGAEWAAEPVVGARGLVPAKAPTASPPPPPIARSFADVRARLHPSAAPSPVLQGPGAIVASTTVRLLPLAQAAAHGAGYSPNVASQPQHISQHQPQPTQPMQALLPAPLPPLSPQPPQPPPACVPVRYNARQSIVVAAVVAPLPPIAAALDVITTPGPGAPQWQYGQLHPLPQPHHNQPPQPPPQQPPQQPPKQPPQPPQQRWARRGTHEVSSDNPFAPSPSVAAPAAAPATRGPTSNYRTPVSAVPAAAGAVAVAAVSSPIALVPASVLGPTPPADVRPPLSPPPLNAPHHPHNQSAIGGAARDHNTYAYAYALAAAQRPLQPVTEVDLRVPKSGLESAIRAPVSPIVYVPPAAAAAHAVHRQAPALRQQQPRPGWAGKPSWWG